MNRTLALKMALVMLNKSLENKITLVEFKQTTDSILLENKNDYEFYYNAMDKETQKEFDTYPIFNLLNITTTSE